MKTLTFKVTDDEARAIRLGAKMEKVSLSEYLRRCARVPASAPKKPKLIRCPKTGAMIFAPCKGEPPLTTETVRELLFDFP